MRAEVVARATRGRSEPPSFIGRDVDRRRVEGLLDLGERLVTLVGGGGIGKTTLALMLAEWAEARFTSVSFCDLSEARDETAFHDQLARVLEQSGSVGGSAASDRLGQALARRGRCLVVLDNVEQIAATVAGAVARWLEQAPEARFLVASREPLWLHEEIRHDLRPLTLPDRPEDIECSDAGRLLLALGRRARSDFSISASERPPAYALLLRLDGIPLAIELAAPRVAALGWTETAERMIAAPLDALGSGPRDASPRQATLRATIEWSWALCSPHERSALAQCATFRGGFTLRSAERVVDLSDHPDAPPVADVVLALHDKSLLVRMRQRPDRFAPYLGVREIAEERLEPLAPDEPLAGPYRRHAEHFAALGAERASAVRGPDGPAALGELRVERENLLAAADRAIAAGGSDAAQGARALLSLWPVAKLEAVFQSLASRLDGAIAAVTPEVVTSEPEELLIGRLLLTRGAIGWRAARYEEALSDLERVEEMARAAEDAGLMARAQLQRAWALNRTSHPDARGAAEEALASAQGAGELALEAEALRLLAGIAQDQGDVEEASRLGPRACAAAERSGDAAGTVSALATQGVVELRRGDLDRAARRFERALALTREISYRPLTALLLGWLGTAHLLRGDAAEAVRSLRPSAQMLGRTGRPEYEGFFRSLLAVALAGTEGEGDARAEAERARALLRPGGPTDVGDAPLPCAVLGMIDAMRGSAAAAALAFDEARTVITREPEEWQLVVDLFAAHLDVAAARSAHDQGEPWGPALERARRPLERARRSDDDSTPVIESSIPARVACSVLEGALEAAEREIAPSAGQAPAERGAVRIHERGEWFELPSGARVDCRHRGAPARLLAHLAELRVTSPGTTAPLEDLVAVGWPGEHMAWDAAVNRLRVAISTLRKLGLRGYLRNTRGGYHLEPSVPVRLERDSAS